MDVLHLKKQIDQEIFVRYDENGLFIFDLPQGLFLSDGDLQILIEIYEKEGWDKVRLRDRRLVFKVQNL